MMARAAHASGVSPTEDSAAAATESKTKSSRPVSAAGVWSGGALSEAHVNPTGLLRLAHSKLNVRHVEPLCQAISAAKKRADSRADSRADGVADGEGRARLPGITGLDLRDNILDAAAVARLVECLVEVGTVVDLDLSDNAKLGPAGAASLRQLLPPSFAPEGSPALRTLSLANSGCGPVGAAALGAALELNVCLTRIDLSNCRLGDAGAVAFGAVFAENVSLEACNLSGNGVGVRGAKAVAEGLRYNNDLLDLDLSHNPRMGDIGVACFGAALEENAKLASLNLSVTGAGKASALVLSEALDSNPALKVLRMNGNPLGEGGIRRLLRAASLNGSLEVLNLKGCVLFDVDTIAANILEHDRERAAAFAGFSKGGKKKKKSGSGETDGGGKGANAAPAASSFGGGKKKKKTKKGSGDAGKGGDSLIEPKDPIDFNRQTPNGICTLRLAVPYERQVAIELTYLWHKHGAASWKWAKLDGVPFTLTPAHNWPERIPEAGVLETAVYVRRLLEHQMTTTEVGERGLRIVAGELESPENPEWWRLQFICTVARCLYFTCEQCAALVSKLERSNFGASSDRAEAVVALFPRVVDPQNFHETVLIPLLSEAAARDVLSRLGSLSGFSAQNPTGRYIFNLSVSHERNIMLRLLEMTRREGLWFSDPLKRNWRNVSINGEAMSDEALMQLEHWTPPSAGVMVLDYVSYVYPHSRHGVGLSEEQLASNVQDEGDNSAAGGSASSSHDNTRASSPSSRSKTPDGGGRGNHPGLVSAQTAVLMLTATPARDRVYASFVESLRRAIGGDYLDALLAELEALQTSEERRRSQLTASGGSQRPLPHGVALYRVIGDVDNRRDVDGRSEKADDKAVRPALPMSTHDVELLCRRFLNQYFVSSQQTVRLLQLMDQVRGDIEKTERSIRARLRYRSAVGKVVRGVQTMRVLGWGRSVEEVMDQRLRKKKEEEEKDAEAYVTRGPAAAAASSSSASTAAPTPAGMLRFHWWTEAERRVDPYKVNLAVASYAKVCDRDGVSNIFRALTPAEFNLAAKRLGWLNVLDMTNPGRLRYALDLSRPEEKEVLRRLCNLAMESTFQREQRQNEADEANTDAVATGDRVADEKVFDVWQNVHMNGKPFSVKQDAKMWAVLNMGGRKGELVFDVVFINSDRQLAAAKTIASQFRAYKMRLEAIRSALAERPKGEVTPFARRWMRNAKDNGSGKHEVLEDLNIAEDGKIQEEDEEDEEARGERRA